MFKNRTLEVRLAKKARDKAAEARPHATTQQLDAIEEMTKTMVKYAAIAFVSSFAATVVLQTASQIAINAAPKQ